MIDEPVKANASQFKIVDSYKPDGIPAKYIIDNKGVLRFVTSGFDTDTELINELEAMFGVVIKLKNGNTGMQGNAWSARLLLCKTR